MRFGHLVPFSRAYLFFLCLAPSHGQVNPPFCSSTHNHLDPATHKFISDCDDTTFCSSPVNGTCVPRLCRRDEFASPGVGDCVPPLCPEGAFCPDEGNGCLPLVKEGGACQLDRDDQCAEPPMSGEEAEGRGRKAKEMQMDVFRPLCLQSTCLYANVTLGQKCVADQTTYIDAGPDGQQYNFTVTRHNCVSPRFYCDPTFLLCVKTKDIGDDCSSDQNCESLNCESGTCAEPPEMPTKVQLWQWIVTIASVCCAMLAIVVTLVHVHKRIRRKHYDEIHEYYEEQLSLRRSMFALHSAAADRIDSDELDEKQALRLRNGG
ncbi:hypothetical protein EIP91_007845 [Steccherinum ochraceum]|uniref:Dickkopf N-terminal cysteine-rich domain-containing protein n=1 Tax=Steccherinum ochraceum TaxID=92696 RepID=A0A4R0RDV7_9APHY|nr:hypothetical protein EIP91_007845 [Steccherinum ochraceum]